MKLKIVGFMLLSCLFLIAPQNGYANEGEDPVQILLTPVEEAVTYAKEGNSEEAKKELHAFHEKWEEVEEGIEESSPEAYEQIESAMAKAEALAQSENVDSEKFAEALVSLEEAIEGYESEEGNVSSSHRPGAKALLGYSHELEEAKESVQSGEWKHAKEEYEEFHGGWEGVEDSIHDTSPEAYESIETNMGLVSASLDAASNKEKAKKHVEKLIQSIQSYANGEGTQSSSAHKEKGISTLINILSEVQTAIDTEDGEKAAHEMEKFISVWPSIEGEVNTRSAAVYESIENQMTEALGMLSSNPPKTDQATDVVTDMKSQLVAVSQDSSYTMWDAAIILLREGLEIILVLSALLAFLKSSGNQDKRRWIWGGAGAGVLASVGLAFILTSIMSAAVSAQNREFMEGITGLVAVVLMFTVGAWLHDKSNLQNWNAYIRQSVGTAIARGSLWSLAGVAFVTVVREGAETIIFYMGIISDISMSTFFTGIGVAVLILAVLAIAILYFSVKVPVRALFLSITVLIYYLAFKFTGESLHALQVVDKLPAHSISGFPQTSLLGIYPTWETTIAQIALLTLIVAQTLRSKKKDQKKHSNQQESKDKMAQ